MELDQETLNSLFKELHGLGVLGQKDVGELEDLFVHYSSQEQLYTRMFDGFVFTTESELRLINRFISRLSEVYQSLISKKLICRSKASTFVPTIYNSLTTMYDGKTNVMIQLVQAIFQECRLQLEIATRKHKETDTKRVHSQDNFDDLSNYYSIGQRKTSIPDWQLNVKVNKTLNNYYNKQHPKLYDAIPTDKLDEQFVYYQSREQNMERLFTQLMEQNQNIKRSINWAQNIDPEKYKIKVQRRLQKLQQITQTYSVQHSTNSSPIKQSAKIIVKKSILPPKQRSVSSNGYEVNNSLQLLNPSILNLQKQTQLLPMNMNKIQIEFKTRSMPFNVLKRKMFMDMLPLHNSKLKGKITKNYVPI